VTLGRFRAVINAPAPGLIPATGRQVTSDNEAKRIFMNATNLRACETSLEQPQVSVRHHLLGGGRMQTLVLRFVSDEWGVTAIEYGLIASLVGIVIITAVTAMGTSLNAVFNSVSASL
jgi:pilus assembly protein Flp/PilA